MKTFNLIFIKKLKRQIKAENLNEACIRAQAIAKKEKTFAQSVIEKQ